MQHGQIPRNRCLPFARCLNALLWCLLFTWLRKWLPSFGRSWHILPKGSMMTGRRIFYTPTTGCSPSIKNCCIHCHVTTPQGQVKGIDPAMVWLVSPHTLGHPRYWNHLLLAPDLLTGLAVFAMRILCRCGFLPTGPLWYCTSCNTREEDAVQGGRLQSIRMLTGTKATALGVLSQWPVIGWVVRRSLRPPTVWPDVSVLGASNLRRVVGYDFHHLGKKYDVPSMGQYPTGLIGLEMIWKMNFVLTVILCMAYLEYFTEPAMAATPASSTLRVSWWTRFFLMPAARVRVPGGSPFSQLQRREKDYPDSWKATKTFTFIGRNNETN